MTKKGKETSAPVMGHDPLAWIAESSSKEVEASAKESSTEVVSKDSQEIELAASEIKEDLEEDKTIEEGKETVTEVVENKTIEVTDVNNGKKNEAEVILLDGDMTIQHIEALHHALADKLVGHSAIILDGCELQQIDTSGVQMLRVFVRESEKVDISLAWRNVPDTLLENATLLGLHDQMLFSNNVDL